MSTNTSFDFASFSRWTGRTFAFAIFCILIYRTVDTSLPPLNLTTISLIVILFGCAMSWFSDRYGGLVILTGAVFLFTISYAHNGHFPSDMVYPFIFVPGVLMLISDAFQVED
jgi:hypothetical protein